MQKKKNNKTKTKIGNEGKKSDLFAILRFDVILQFSNTIGQSKDNFYQRKIFFGGKTTGPFFMTFSPIG